MRVISRYFPLISMSKIVSSSRIAIPSRVPRSSKRVFAIGRVGRSITTSGESSGTSKLGLGRTAAFTAGVRESMIYTAA